MRLSIYGAWRSTILWALVAVTFFNTGCYQYRVATHAQAGVEVSKPITAHALFWGLIQKPKNGIRTPLCDSLSVNGMSGVTIKTNLGYAFITVITLGIWCPMKVQWTCSKPCRNIDTPF